tara:strand:- start:19 stop:795 length:777 start_codon:yes stop_codon:yes gene_type:complete
MYSTIKYNVDDKVAIITLNRPNAYNAFNKEMSVELLDAFKKSKKDTNVRVIVFTGEGKAFCSGQDLKDVSGDDFSFETVVKKRYNPIIKCMYSLGKPIICRVNGVAAGAGCSFALASDIIVMSEKASLIEVFINIGLILDSGSSYFLPRILGAKKAFELATMGTKVSAQEALSLGLANKIAAHEDLDKAVEHYTNYYKDAPTKSIGLIKKLLQDSGTARLNEMLDIEAQYQEIAGSSEDYKEGVNAFLEKRKPVFKGC